MNKIHTIIILVCLVLAFSCQTKRNIDKVNLYIGTGGYVQAFPGDSVTYDSIRNNKPIYPFGGLTYVGAVVPFGMVQLSPDCNTSGFGWSAGYHYSDSTILGFSHGHTSGNGMAFGHFLFVPGIGEAQFVPGSIEKPHEGYRSRFSHSSEKASLGYYSVMLDDSKIQAELTATIHSGFHRYTFSEGQQNHLLVDLVHGLGEWANPDKASLKIENDTTISLSRLTKNGVTTYLTAIFSKRIENTEIQLDGKSISGEKTVTGKKLKACFFFTDNRMPLLIKVGISFTSEDDAKNNLKVEIPNWNFDQIVANAQAIGKKNWEKFRSKAEQPISRRFFILPCITVRLLHFYSTMPMAHFWRLMEKNTQTKALQTILFLRFGIPTEPFIRS